jgi:hypothetical protein
LPEHKEPLPEMHATAEDLSRAEDSIPLPAPATVHNQKLMQIVFLGDQFFLTLFS